jgi:hypothetical protein
MATFRSDPNQMIRKVGASNIWGIEPQILMNPILNLFQCLLAKVGMVLAVLGRQLEETLIFAFEVSLLHVL